MAEQRAAAHDRKDLYMVTQMDMTTLMAVLERTYMVCQLMGSGGSWYWLKLQDRPGVQLLPVGVH